MASPTKITKRIRKQKLSKKGRRRKATLRSKGTTPSKRALFGE